MPKLSFLAGLAAGYVLGARAGRERYDQIASVAAKVSNDPRVQDAAHQAAETAKAQAPVVKDAVTDKVTSAAGTVADKVKPSGTSGGSVDDLEAQLNPDNVALQDNPYPQGDLP